MGDPVQEKEFLRTIRVRCLQSIPSWKELQLEDIDAVPLVGGCSNLLWRVCTSKDNIYPKCVVFRRYCSSEIVDRDTEAKIMEILGEEGITVRVYVDEEDYRIEDFIVGSHPKTDEIFTDELLQIMAQIHSHQDDTVEPVAFRRIARLHRLAKEALPICKHESFDAFREIDIEAEINWLKSQFQKQNLLTGLCHNDLHALNILQTKSLQTSPFYQERNPLNLILIDFEFADFNYIACEWANSFYECCMDNAHPEWPCFHMEKSKWPSKEQQRVLLNKYFEHMLDAAPEDSFIDNFLSQIEMCLLVQHLHWALWSVPSYQANSLTHAIDWGYAEYGAFRLQEYFELKSKLVSYKSGEPCLGLPQQTSI